MGDRFDTGRAEAFSDGVLAIAITLLVLEISVPDDAFRDLWKGIGEQWPSYLAYATSFLTIGAIWLAHHALFRRLRLADGTVMRLNLLLLMLAAFLPFPTRLVSEALDRDDAERAAVIFYGATLLAISIVFTAMCRYAARRENLASPAAREDISELAARAAPNLGFYGIVLIAALFVPSAAAFGFLAIAVLAVFRAKWGEEPVEASSGPPPSSPPSS